jgi:hypothetical protein
MYLDYIVVASLRSDAPMTERTWRVAQFGQGHHGRTGDSNIAKGFDGAAALVSAIDMIGQPCPGWL